MNVRLQEMTRIRNPLMTRPEQLDTTKSFRPNLIVGMMTITIYLMCLFFYPALICGCHFHIDAAIVTIIPLLWSVFILATYQTKWGRVGSWMGFLLACFWLWVGFESNLQFSLRDILRGH